MHTAKRRKESKSGGSKRLPKRRSLDKKCGTKTPLEKIVSEVDGLMNICFIAR